MTNRHYPTSPNAWASPKILRANNLSVQQMLNKIAKYPPTRYAHRSLLASQSPMRQPWILGGALAGILGLVAILVAALTEHRESTPAPLKSRDQRHVELTVTAVQDYARIPVEFTLTNASSRPLRVLDVQKSCSCIQSIVNENVVAPHSTAIVKAVVELSPYDRTKAISCTVVTDDSMDAVRRYTATISLVPPLQFKGELFDFGRVSSEGSSSRTIELTATTRTPQPPLVLSVTSNAPNLKIDYPTHFECNSSAYRGASWRLPVTTVLTPDVSQLSVYTYLRAVVRIDGKTRSTEIPIRWAFERQFTVNPERIILRSTTESNVLPGTTLKVTRNDGAKFRVIDATSSSSSIAVAIDTFEQDSTISVRATRPLSHAERVAAVMRIKTDSPEDPMLLVPVVYFSASD